MLHGVVCEEGWVYVIVPPRIQVLPPRDGAESVCTVTATAVGTVSAVPTEAAPRRGPDVAGVNSWTVASCCG